MKSEKRTVQGQVLEALPDLRFKVRLEDGREIIGYAAGKLRVRKIRILPGDKVTIELSEYDLDKGRIVYRGNIARQ